MLPYDPPGPRAVFAWILGGAGALAVAGLLLVWLATGHVEWRLVTLIGVLWGAWGFFGGLSRSLIEPAGRFFVDEITGNVASPDAAETLDQQTARLERLLGRALEPHHELLIGVRLAEIYRLHQHDATKADALLARLRAKYPDAPELVASG